MQHFLLALSLAVTIGVAEARIPYDMGDPSVTIVITQKDGDYPIGNRASSVIPIAGYVDTDAGVVLLNFSQPCGVVHISFENLSDGSNFDTTVNGRSCCQQGRGNSISLCQMECGIMGKSLYKMIGQ